MDVFFLHPNGRTLCDLRVRSELRSPRLRHQPLQVAQLSVFLIELRLWIAPVHICLKWWVTTIVLIKFIAFSYIDSFFSVIRTLLKHLRVYFCGYRPLLIESQCFIWSLAVIQIIVLGASGWLIGDHGALMTDFSHVFSHHFLGPDLKVWRPRGSLTLEGVLIINAV